MIKIFVFLTGIPIQEAVPSLNFYTACAITEQGKWLAGAVSRKDSTTALERCYKMAEMKAIYMLSKPSTIEFVKTSDERLQKALDEAFKTMP